MKLFIGCSSSNELDKVYMEECSKFLDCVLRENDLVYGAYNNGIMKLAFDSAKKYNRKIYAVATEKYKSELEMINADYKLPVPTTYNRSEELVRLSDMVIILPGGIGTVTEFISSIEAMRNSDFEKPILIYNINGFYDEFISFLDKIYNEKFSSAEGRNFYYIASDQESAVRYVKEKEIEYGKKN